MRISLLIFLSLIAVAATAEKEAAVYYETRRFDLDNVSLDLDGFMLKYAPSNEGGSYFSVSSLSDADGGGDYLGVDAGWRQSFLQYDRAAFGLNVEVGFGHLDVAGFEDSNSLFSLSAGPSALFPLSNNVSINASFGYKLYLDRTEDTQCNDGTSVGGTAIGACAEHGGVAEYNDRAGNGGGAYLRSGLTIMF